MEETAKHYVIVSDPAGVVIDMHGWADPHDSDKYFTQTCQGYGIEPNEQHYERGLMLVEDGTSIELIHIEEAPGIEETKQLLNKTKL